MGTNFHWLKLDDGRTADDFDDLGDPEIHIGKRSAAGWFCWDCMVPLVEGGATMVHQSAARCLDACPKCGAAKPERSTHNPVMVELGFAESAVQRPTGVSGASSFSWAQTPSVVRARCEQHCDDELVSDEYGRRMTGGDFLRMLNSNCPIESTRFVGRWFG